MDFSFIKELRKAAGLTVLELENACGVSKPTLTKLENNRAEGSFDSVKKVGKYFDISLPVMIAAATEASDCKNRKEFLILKKLGRCAVMEKSINLELENIDSTEE